MKLLSKKDLKHVQLKNKLTGELFSLSSLVSENLGMVQNFVHHDILSPGQKASSAHRHSLIEELVFVIKGEVVVVTSGNETVLPEGSFVFFSPQDQDLHFIQNKSNLSAEILGFSQSTEFDVVIYSNESVKNYSLPSYYFDQNLRDVPNNKAEWESFVSELSEILKNTSNEEEELKILETLGMAQRTLLRLDEAEVHLLKALAKSYRHPVKTKIVQNLIRLAHVYQWKNEFSKAQLLFKQAQALIDELQVSENLVAAYHQHYGKLFFDLENWTEALSEFQIALKIRNKISAPADQIESTQLAIDVTTKKMESNKNV